MHPHHGHLGGVAQAQDRDCHHGNVAFDLRLADAVLDLGETDDGLWNRRFWESKNVVFEGKLLVNS